MVKFSVVVRLSIVGVMIWLLCSIVVLVVMFLFDCWMCLFGVVCWWIVIELMLLLVVLIGMIVVVLVGIGVLVMIWCVVIGCSVSMLVCLVGMFLVIGNIIGFCGVVFEVFLVCIV